MPVASIPIIHRLPHPTAWLKTMTSWRHVALCQQWFTRLRDIVCKHLRSYMWTLNARITLSIAIMNITAYALFGYLECAYIACVCLLLLVFTGISVVLQQRAAAQYAMQLRTNQRVIHIGQTLTITVSVTNQTNHSVRPIQVFIPVNHVLYPCTIPALTSHQSTDVTLQLTPTERAELIIGPVNVTTSDPLNLWARHHECAQAITAYVQPTIIRLAASTNQLIDSASSAAITPRESVDGLDFQALREYHAGDDVRRIHWPSSMRTSTPLVRVCNDETAPTTLLLLDTEYSHYADANQFELATSVFASFGMHRLEQSAQLFTSVDAGTFQRMATPLAFIQLCCRVQREHHAKHTAFSRATFQAPSKSDNVQQAHQRPKLTNDTALVAAPSLLSQFAVDSLTAGGQRDHSELIIVTGGVRTAHELNHVATACAPFVSRTVIIHARAQGRSTVSALDHHVRINLRRLEDLPRVTRDLVDVQ